MIEVKYTITPQPNSSASGASAYPCFFNESRTQNFTIQRTTPLSLPMSAYKVVKQADGSYGTLEYGNGAKYNSTGIARLTFQTDRTSNKTLFNTNEIQTTEIQNGRLFTKIYNLLHSDDNSGNYDVNLSILSYGTSASNIKAVSSASSKSGLNFYNNYYDNYFVLTIYVETLSEKATATSYTSSIIFGEEASVTINKSAENGNTYKVQWSLGSNSSDLLSIDSGYTKRYIIPKNWSNGLVDTSASGELKVYSYYNGTEIGVSTYNIVYNIKEIGAPTITGITPSYYNNYGKNAYIQRLTGVKLIVHAYTDDISVNIQKYTLTTPDGAYTHDSSYSGTKNEFYIDTLKTGGTYSYTATVVDSNGKSSSYTDYITVIPYNPPSLSAVSAGRYSKNSQDQYVPDEEGVYGMLKATLNYSNILSNSATLSFQIKTNNSSYSSPITLNATSSSTGSKTYNDVIISSDLSTVEGIKYTINLIAEDSFGNSVSTELVLSAASYSIHVRNGDQPGGTGVAIGTISEEGHVFQVASDWTAKWGNEVLARVRYFEPTYEGQTPPNPVAGLIWLKPKS